MKFLALCEPYNDVLAPENNGKKKCHDECSEQYYKKRPEQKPQNEREAQETVSIIVDENGKKKVQLPQVLFDGLEKMKISITNDVIVIRITAGDKEAKHTAVKSILRDQLGFNGSVDKIEYTTDAFNEC